MDREVLHLLKLIITFLGVLPPRLRKLDWVTCPPSTWAKIHWHMFLDWRGERKEKKKKNAANIETSFCLKCLMANARAKILVEHNLSSQLSSNIKTLLSSRTPISHVPSSMSSYVHSTSNKKCPSYYILHCTMSQDFYGILEYIWRSWKRSYLYIRWRDL